MKLLDRIQRLLGRSDVWFGGALYMRRLWRIGPKWGPGIRLHNIVRSDLDRELHDHPFTFVTFILWGGYWEVLVDGSRTWHGPGSVLVRSAEVLHRLELDRPAWTFVLRGPIRRMWGFLAADGWVPWEEFVRRKRDAGQADPKVAGRPFSAESSV